MYEANVDEGLCGICGEELLTRYKLKEDALTKEQKQIISGINYGFCEKANVIYDLNTLKVLFNRVQDFLDLEKEPSFRLIQTIEKTLQDHPKLAHTLETLRK